MILIVLGITAGLILFVFLALEIRDRLSEVQAMRAIQKYCRSNQLIVKEIKSLPDHYGIYFQFDGRKYYSNFQFVKGKIKWKKESPLEKVSSQETEQKLISLNRRRVKLLDSRI